ncbi:MAG TPA: serine hydrolase domain-containing protein, partial [Burkholderiales bacterium]|nr:serine hydrolase domain-containing protein [Burkholderiales bacterium]
MNTPLPLSEPRALGFAPERLKRIETALRIEIEARTLPGAVLVIAREGKIAYFETFGHLDPVARIAMPKDALFSIASMTKPIVAVGALMLCEEGRLMVNEPVARYVPQLAQMKVAAKCDGSETVPPARAMTIEDLMRHTAGLSYGRGATPLHARYPVSSDSASSKWTGREFLEALAQLPLHYQPGTSWEYGLGLDVLGLAIEAITGTPLARYLDERLFRPLGMHDTSFTVPPGKVARYAKALTHDPVTREPQTLRDGTRPHKFDCGGGCAVSTAADYLRFAQMLLDGGTLEGTRVLGRKMVEYMTSDHITPEIDTSRLREYPNIN